MTLLLLVNLGLAGGSAAAPSTQSFDVVSLTLHIVRVVSITEER